MACWPLVFMGKLLAKFLNIWKISFGDYYKMQKWSFDLTACLCRRGRFVARSSPNDFWSSNWSHRAGYSTEIFSVLRRLRVAQVENVMFEIWRIDNKFQMKDITKAIFKKENVDIPYEFFTKMNYISERLSDELIYLFIQNPNLVLFFYFSVSDVGYYHHLMTIIGNLKRPVPK